MFDAILLLFILTQYWRVTDERTHKRTDRQTLLLPRQRSA